MQPRAGFLLFSLSFLLNSYCSSNTNSGGECVELSKQLHYSLNSYLTTRKKEDLRKMDSLLILSRRCDQKNGQLAWIRIDVYRAKGDLDSAMAEIRTLGRWYKGPDLDLTKGQIFQMMQQVDSAKACYRDAIAGFQVLQRKDSTNFSHIVGELEATERLHGKQAAKEKISFYRRKYPNFETELEISSDIIDKD